MKKVPGKIVKLEETVINRIAAGEVIQRPANALKELLENALDAGSKNIQVSVKAGGLKLLQIQDDGSGIREEDLGIVCERFTTSKLRTFEDLQTIGTYGFRGEALASISHVAHLTILTKTESSLCAFRAEYADGQLKVYSEGEKTGNQAVQNPKRCAGKQGTTITVEDLFYNMDTRRKALKNTTDEHNKIADVVTRYAIHNPETGFSLKKYGETNTEIRTPPNSTILDNIKILYGSTISRELMEVECEDAGTKFKMKGYVSNVNFSTKKLMFTLFINNRLVDSLGLRKSIESIYSNYLPKGAHPFVYLSIEIDPRNVDVNVHPTKHEVNFLHEDAIVSKITSSIENLLLGANESRTFLVQSLLPGASGPSTSTANAISRKRKENDTEDSFNAKTGRPTGSDPKNMVRTDPKMQKLDRFMSSTPNPDMTHLQSFRDSPSKLCINVDKSLLESFSEPLVDRPPFADNNNSGVSNSQPVTNTTSNLPQRREIKLKSVLNMRAAINKECHDGLLNVFRNHTFVGCVDRTLCLFQHETSLYICNISKLSTELFYQKLVAEFGNFGKINIDDKIELKELIAFAMDGEDWPTIDEDKETVIETSCKRLMGKRKMLKDYFSLEFDDEGRIVCIPMILTNYFPCMEGLANYIMNLAKKVDWTNEQRCFESFCDVTAQFYAIPQGNEEACMEQAPNGHTWKWNIEHVIFPELQKSFLPPKVFAEDSTIVQLTTLPELYKVFERC